MKRALTYAEIFIGRRIVLQGLSPKYLLITVPTRKLKKYIISKVLNGVDRII